MGPQEGGAVEPGVEAEVEAEEEDEVTVVVVVGTQLVIGHGRRDTRINNGGGAVTRKWRGLGARQAEGVRCECMYDDLDMSKSHTRTMMH